MTLKAARPQTPLNTVTPNDSLLPEGTALCRAQVTLNSKLYHSLGMNEIEDPSRRGSANNRGYFLTARSSMAHYGAASSCLPEECAEGLCRSQGGKGFLSDQEKMNAFHSAHLRAAGLKHVLASSVSQLLLLSSSPTRKLRDTAKGETVDRDISRGSPFLGQPVPFLQY